MAQFDGDTGKGNPPLYRDHPDMAIGANGTQVVETTGQNLNVYSYSGTVIGSMSISTFISNAGGTVGMVNDPRLVYDPFISRWLFVCSCSANYLIVSASSDAMGAWKAVPLSADSGDLLMRIGFDRNGVYVSELDVNTTAKLFAIPNADVAWSGAGTISLVHMGVASGKPFEETPAIDHDASKSATAPEYFVARSGPPQNGANVSLSLIVDSVTWSGLPSSPVASFSSSKSIPTSLLYNTPIDARQPASPNIRGAENHRIFSLYAFGGTNLYGVVGSGPCSSNCSSQGTDAHNLFFFFDIAIPGLVLNKVAKISDAQTDFMFPSLAVDSKGNVSMTATGVSQSENPSVYEWHRLATDSLGTLNGPNLLASGNTSYSCASNPVGWGTYSNMAQDGTDGTRLWSVQEYGKSSTQCNWVTQLIGFSL
jgi:hypothetical protein